MNIDISNLRPGDRVLFRNGKEEKIFGLCKPPSTYDDNCWLINFTEFYGLMFKNDGMLAGQPKETPLDIVEIIPQLSCTAT